jgi:hypothetical protein
VCAIKCSHTRRSTATEVSIVQLLLSSSSCLAASSPRVFSGCRHVATVRPASVRATTGRSTPSYAPTVSASQSAHTTCQSWPRACTTRRRGESRARGPTSTSPTWRPSRRPSSSRHPSDPHHHHRQAQHRLLNAERDERLMEQ